MQNQSQKPEGRFSGSQKTKGQDKVKSGKTVQTLLAAKIDKDKEKPTKIVKRNFSEVSDESNSSMDLTGLISLQKDLDEIKHKLEGIVTKKDLDDSTKDLIKRDDVERMVINIVGRMTKDIELRVEMKMEKKLNKVKQDMQETIDALSIENENLKQKTEYLKLETATIKKEMAETNKLTKEAIISSNYNEQYSRKTNIKVHNFPQKERQNLRKDFIEIVKKDLNVQLEERDVVAIHRLPSNKPGPKPLIVKLFSTDVKRQVMKEKKNLQNNVRFYDDITKRNLDFMTKMKDIGCFASVWYYNCNVYGVTESDLRLKLGLYDDINLRIRQGK